MDNLLISKLLPREAISKTVAEVRKAYGDGKFKTVKEEREVSDLIRFLWFELFLKFYNDYSFFMWLLYEYKFIKTDEVLKAGRKFLNHGSYTHDMTDEEATIFWKKETLYRVHGRTFKCLIKKGDAERPENLIPFWIPGKYYGFLNYGLITRSSTDVIEFKEKISKLSKKELDSLSAKDKLKILFTKNQTRLNAKIISSLPDFWDIHCKYFFFKDLGVNLSMGQATGKARRKGWSLVNGWSAFDNYDLIPNSNSAFVAQKEDYLNDPNDGIFTFAKRYANHINDHTVWRKNRIIDNSREILSGYMLKGTKEMKGFLSSMVAIVGNDPDSFRGKKYYEINMEEMGSFPKARAIHSIGKSSAESGNLTVGLYNFFGTVGSNDEDMEFFKEVFYNPSNFDCMPFANIYDDPSSRQNEVCGFFVGQLECLEGGGMDKWGNSDYETASKLYEVAKETNKKRLSTLDYNKWVRERALNTIEAFGTSGSSYFTTEMLKNHYNKILASKHQLTSDIPQPTYGWLVEEERKVKNEINTYSIFNKVATIDVNFKPLDSYEVAGNKKLIPITSEEIMKTNNLHGVITVWEQPIISNGFVPEGLYDIVYDPMGTDKVDKTYKDSLAAIFVIKRANPAYNSHYEMVVASYVGRLDSMAEVDRVAYRLCLYYNCKILVEVNKGETGSNFKSWGAFDKLYPRFSTLDNKIVAGQPNMIGVYMTTELKNLCIGYLKNLLYTEVDRDSDGNTIYWFEKAIYCPLTVQQLAAFKDSGNYDTVSALLIFMVLKSAENFITSKVAKSQDIFSFLEKNFK